jgi:hypothetical protein
MAIATLTVDLVAKLAKFESNLGRATYMLKKSTGHWNDMLGSLGAGISAGGVVLFVKSAIDSLAALDDLAEKTGATVESLSALSDIARIGGHDMGTLEAGMVRLTKALAGGDDEAKAAGHALEALGLKAADLRNMETGTAMLEVAHALDKFGDSGGKSALVMDLLGKNGAAMLPFLKDLAETGALNAKVTAEQAAEAERLQKSWNQLKVYSDDLGRSLANTVVPALNDVIKNFNTAKEAGFGLFQSLTGIGVRGINESIGDAKLNSGQRLVELNKELVQLEKNKDYFSGRGDSYAARDVQVDIAAVEKRIAYYKALQRQLVGEQFSGSQFLDARDLALLQKGDLSGYTTASGSGAKGGKTKVQEVIDALGSGTYMTRDKETAAAIKESFDFENWAWGEIAKDRETAATAAVKYDEALKKSVESLYAATDAGRFDGMIASIEQAEEAFNRGFISQDKLDAITSGLFDVNDELKKSKSISEELGLTFTSAFENAIVGGKKFSEVLQGLGEDILRLVTRKNITEPLATAIGKFDWSKLLPSANGNVFSGAGIAAYSGQIVSRPTVFPFASGIGLMGEAGPEAILPLTRRNGKLGVSGGGAMVVNIIEQPGSGGKTAQRNEGGVNILDVFVERIKSAVAQDISDGRGAIPSALSNSYGLNRAAGAC